MRDGLTLRFVTMGVLLGCAMALAGCAGFETASVDGPCLDDSKECVSQRTSLVQSMSNDPARVWIGQAVGRGTVASGVRLFAYQNVRDKLSCPELANGIGELESAKQVLAQGPAPGQTMLRHNEIKAMTTDVRNALAASHQRKCGGALAQG